MVEFNSIQAWITVDDIALEHYNIETSAAQKEVTCWVPAEEGKNFAVKWDVAVKHSSHEIAAWVTMDGGISEGQFFHNCGPKSISAVAMTSTSAKPFTFSRLDLTDDDSYLHSDMTSQRLGEITLKVWIVVIGDLYDMPARILPEPEQVHERAKKGLAHRVKLGEEIETPRQQRRQTTKVERLVTFTFKYRSIDILSANGIAPFESHAGEKRRASATLEAESDSEEVKLLQAQIDAIRARKQGGKSKRVKVETRSRPLVFGEIIDLT